MKSSWGLSACVCVCVCLRMCVRWLNVYPVSSLADETMVINVFCGVVSGVLSSSMANPTDVLKVILFITFTNYCGGTGGFSGCYTVVVSTTMDQKQKRGQTVG